MGLFSFKSHNKSESSIKTIVLENFNDNSHNWVDSYYSNPLLKQQIKNGMLFLESISEDMGVISYTDFKINQSKDFNLEVKVKIESDFEDRYMTFDFGIDKRKNALRNIGGQNISTTYGQINFYFGFSDSKEVLITKWNKGREKYFYRDYCDWIDLSGFNILRVSKLGKMISFYINNKFVHSQKFYKLPGDGFGFSTSPNAKLWVDYFKIEN